MQQAMIGRYNDPSHPLGLKYETYPFFDYNDTILHVSVLPDSIGLSRNKNFYLLIEIKKKNAQPEKYVPLLSKEVTGSFEGRCYKDSMNISSGLYSGNFLCIVTLKDENKQVVDRAILPFQALREDVWKPGMLTEVKPDTTQQKEIQLEHTFVHKYNREQLLNNIEALSPLAKHADADFIKNASAIQDLDELKRFFYFFWLERNASDPEKAWKEYANKLMFVAKLYGTTSIKGYNTDRGRLYLLYGEPDKVERILTEKNAKPYEIWFYYTSANGRHNVKFLFFQPGMMSNHFLLLHSTETDELINPDWKRYLLNEDLTNDKEVKLKHRVFDYFSY